MALRLANKSMDVYRLVAGNYQLLSQNIPMRYESITNNDNPSDVERNRTKSYLISSNMLVDKIDLKISDKCFITNDSKYFVVCGIALFDEARISHLEVLLRETNSEFHEEVLVRKLSGTQENYDTIFNQWENTKNVTDTTVKALVDIVKPGQFAQLEAAGKLQNAQYVVTLDLPIEINTDDKLVIRGDEYLISDILDFPYQLQAIVTKVLPEGRQFTI